MFIFLALPAVLAIGIVLGLAYREAARWTFPERRPLSAVPEDFGLAYENVTLTSEDGLHLPAWYVPGRNGATIILIHGLNGNRGGELELAAPLVARGYGALLLDLRAHGQADGRATSLGLFEVRDIRAAVKFLQARPEVDPTKLGVLGRSLGGSVAIMSAAEIPEIKAVAVESTFASLDWLVQNQFARLANVPSWLGSVVLFMGGLQAGMNPADVAPVDRICKISPRPILIMHGELDEMFLPANAELLARAACGPTELWMVPGVQHGRLFQADPTEYIDRVGWFFDRALFAAS